MKVKTNGFVLTEIPLMNKIIVDSDGMCTITLDDGMSVELSPGAVEQWAEALAHAAKLAIQVQEQARA
jgi:hypothetical protein